MRVLDQAEQLAAVEDALNREVRRAVAEANEIRGELEEARGDVTELQLINKDLTQRLDEYKAKDRKQQAAADATPDRKQQAAADTTPDRKSSARACFRPLLCILEKALAAADGDSLLSLVQRVEGMALHLLHVHRESERGGPVDDKETFLDESGASIRSVVDSIAIGIMQCLTRVKAAKAALVAEPKDSSSGGREWSLPAVARSPSSSAQSDLKGLSELLAKEIGPVCVQDEQFAEQVEDLFVKKVIETFGPNETKL